MSRSMQPAGPPPPDPWERAARAPATQARLHVAPPALHGAALGVICRDTRGTALSSPQRLTHLPATPFVCLSSFQHADVGCVRESVGGPVWRPFPARVMLSGSQSTPLVTWAPETGRVVLVLFTVDVALQLFGVEPAAVHDRFMDAYEELDASWWPLLRALQSAEDDASTLAALEQHVGRRWQAVSAASAPLTSLRQVGRYWLERIALQAGHWGRSNSPRQVERRMKALSGRSLREWQTLLKAESVFFSARDRYEAGLPFDWAGLAMEEGFADQSHLVRAARRITGFAPTAFAQRYVEDESFWLYRLWV